MQRPSAIRSALVACLAAGCAGAQQTPTIEFTSVPPYGAAEGLSGRVTGVAGDSARVAVLIDVGGWWNKPTWAEPTVPIRADGRFDCSVATAGTDLYATRIAAFVVPAGFAVPQLKGNAELPEEVQRAALASLIVDRQPRRLTFSGRTWWVKRTNGPHGPGPNLFSDGEENVWVDEQGRLHLAITERDGRWQCAEVGLDESLGYGTYRFYISSRIDRLDPNIVAGLFTWDDAAPQYHYREIDFEFSRWGDPGSENAQFVVQPFATPGNIKRFRVELTGDPSTHALAWTPERLDFVSTRGHYAEPPRREEEIARWAYEGDDLPRAGGENVRINLWLMDGRAPIDGEGAELVIDRFEFEPQEAQTE